MIQKQEMSNTIQAPLTQATIERTQETSRWSRRKLESEMRKAGWHCLGYGEWQYKEPGIHGKPVVVKLDAYETTTRRKKVVFSGVVWVHWATAQLTPPPF